MRILSDTWSATLFQQWVLVLRAHRPALALGLMGAGAGVELLMAWRAVCVRRCLQDNPRRDPLAGSFTSKFDTSGVYQRRMIDSPSRVSTVGFSCLCPFRSFD